MQRISVQDSHRLCSGQIITSLADAVKELIDNALDAGASSIQIGLVDGGLQAIELSDNGSGIREQDFDQLCLKYTTSKLTCFEDLKTVTSLGFRGEALSSLCSLCENVRIVTKCNDVDIGHVLEFDESGNLIKKIRSPRSCGTTVTLKGLFKRLAVRRKFLEKEKLAASKIVNLVLDYALALPGIQFQLTDSKNGQKKELLNVCSVKTLSERIAVSLKPRPEFETLPLASDILPEVADEFAVKLDDKAGELISKIKMDACISRPGCGRSNSERQFFSVNGRPVDFVKLAKIINQTFRSHDPTGSGNQYPFFVMNLSVPLEMLDVNVTPDKRTVYVSHENALFALIKSSIIQLYGQNSVSLQQARYTESCSQVTIVTEDRETSPRQRLNDFSFESPSTSAMASKRITDFFDITPRPSAQTPAAPVVGESLDPGTRRAAPFPFPESAGYPPLQPVSLNRKDGPLPVHQTAQSVLSTMHRITAFADRDESIPRHRRDQRSRSGSNESIDPMERSAHVRSHIRRLSVSPGTEVSRSNKRIRYSTPVGGETGENSPPTFRVPEISHIQRTRARSEGDLTHVTQSNPPPTSASRNDEVDHVQVSPSPAIPKRPSISLTIDMDEIQDGFELPDTDCSQGSQRFELDMDSAVSEEEAVGEMQLRLQKADFKEMRIIGQFNKGFIVTQLGKNLFIVDQHASDERRNFDDLLENFDLEPQLLMTPERLHFTGHEESIFELYEHRFLKNGFRFAPDNMADKGSRYNLIAVPSAADKLLSSQDVYELLETMTNAPNIPGTIRPTRVKDILAMKACKKSIKMNDSLSLEQMRKVIDRMSETSSPWTCAHGRPTVRFLSRVGQEKPLLSLSEVSSQPVEEL